MSADLRGSIDRVPRVELRLVSPADHFPDAIIDTGFAGAIQLPAGSFARLKIRPETRIQVELADGSTSYRPLVIGTVAWLGEEKDVDLIEFGPDVLSGMELLRQTEITLEENAVTLRRLHT